MLRSSPERFAFAFAALVLAACSHKATTGGTGTGGTTSSSSATGMGGTTSSATTTGGFTTSSATTTSASTSTGASGTSASDLVNAGGVCKSPSYTMVLTFGQSTQNQSVTTSPSYKMQGGLIGKTN